MKRFISLLLAFCLLIACSALLFIGCNEEDDDDDDIKGKTEKTTMVCLGDSITWGQDGTPGTEEKENKQMKSPYPSIIKTTLGYDVENLAVPGATICTNVKREDGTVRPSIQAQLDEITFTPDIISVMGGANDSSSDVAIGDPKSTDTKTLYGGVRYLCQQLKQQYPETYIFFMTPVQTASGGEGSSREKVAEVIKEVCAEFDIPVYDAFHEVEVEFTEGFSSDGVHLPQKFVREELAPKIIDFIRTNYKKSA